MKGSTRDMEAIAVPIVGEGMIPRHLPDDVDLSGLP
jgi:hypothetical protein